MPKQSLPSQDYLLQRLCYDMQTGVLTWKRSPKLSNAINAKIANKPALSCLSASGYLRGRIDQKCVQAHRVIWKMVHGTEPEEIDHINGDRSDNRIENLQASNRLKNSKNMRRRSDNSSGVTGVWWHKAKKKWAASINDNKKRIHLGLFESKEAANEARSKYKERLGYTARHGM